MSRGITPALEALRAPPKAGVTRGPRIGPAICRGTSNAKNPVEADSLATITSIVPSRRLSVPAPLIVPSRVLIRTGATWPIPSRRSNTANRQAIRAVPPGARNNKRRSVEAPG